MSFISKASAPTPPRWSTADHLELSDLIARKAQFDAHFKPGVEAVATFVLNALGYSLKTDERADHHNRLTFLLIDRADQIRDALQPFDSGVRPEVDRAG